MLATRSGFTHRAEVQFARLDDTGQALLRSHGGPGAGLALTTCPLCRVTSIEPQLFRVLLLRRLHLPLPLTARHCRWPSTRLSWPPPCSLRAGRGFGEARLSATPSHKHGLCPPFGFQRAFMWSIADAPHEGPLKCLRLAGGCDVQSELPGPPLRITARQEQVGSAALSGHPFSLKYLIYASFLKLSMRCATFSLSRRRQRRGPAVELTACRYSVASGRAMVRTMHHFHSTTQPQVNHSSKTSFPLWLVFRKSGRRWSSTNDTGKGRLSQDTKRVNLKKGWKLQGQNP